MLRVLIVDDEAPSRRKIRFYLRDVEDCEVIGECANGAEALAAIADHAPDIVFLDVQMPSMTGFNLVSELQRLEGPLPAIVFVTAYDSFAVQAFDVMAVDYLLKPFSQPRFEQALQRARIACATGEQQSLSVKALPAASSAEPAKGLNRLLVRDGEEIEVILTKDIQWIGAANNYLEVHTPRKTFVMRKTLGEIEAELGNVHFVRIHRSTIVNIRYIRMLRPLFKRDHAVLLLDGTELVATRTFYDNLLAALTRQ
jgi:two-component system LytT family response regulator